MYFNVIQVVLGRNIELETAQKIAKNKTGNMSSMFPVEVENTGVEPVTSCMPCKRSSQMS